MRQGSKSRHFVMVQINTKQFPFEFINISDVDPRCVDSRACARVSCVRSVSCAWKISIKQFAGEVVLLSVMSAECDGEDYNGRQEEIPQRTNKIPFY